MLVEFTVEDFKRAVECGLKRQTESIVRGDKDNLYEKQWLDGMLTHVLGACGEIVASKALGIEALLDVNTYRTQPDLWWGGWPVEVRHRRSHTHDLIVRETDSADQLYCLTTGLPPDMHFNGVWDWSHPLRDEWKRDYGNYGKPVYFIPQEYLTNVHGE